MKPKLGPRGGRYITLKGRKRYLSTLTQMEKRELGQNSKFDEHQKIFRKHRHTLRKSKDPNVLKVLWKHIQKLNEIPKKERDDFTKEAKNKYKQLKGRGLDRSK